MNSNPVNNWGIFEGIVLTLCMHAGPSLNGDIVVYRVGAICILCEPMNK